MGDNLLQGYDFREAVDGRHGVSVYKQDGPFECVARRFNHLRFLMMMSSVVLLDLSMPVLDGRSRIRL